MTATVTDLFCGAGGSSLGAHAAGLELVMAANHWQTAIDVHQAHFPAAGHDCADISQADPHRYPRTDILLASPECTNRSQARGVSRRRQDPTLFDAPDPAAERSRPTIWDVVRFAEQMAYDAIVVERSSRPPAGSAGGPGTWPTADLGYEHQVLSHNSMHHGVPQSRDRIYVVFTQRGLAVDLEMELAAHCRRCDAHRAVRQGWKNGRTAGRYRQQWIWNCTHCGTSCEPGTRPAADIIDWTLPCPRIGDRPRPLAAATRARILAGLRRYGWAPTPIPQDPSSAGGFLLQTAHGGRIHDLDRPHPTVCASDDRLAFVVPMRSGRNRSHRTDEPMATVVAGGNYGGLVVPLRRHGHAAPASGPLPTEHECVEVASEEFVLRLGVGVEIPHGRPGRHTVMVRDDSDGLPRSCHLGLEVATGTACTGSCTAMRQRPFVSADAPYAKPPEPSICHEHTGRIHGAPLPTP